MEQLYAIGIVCIEHVQYWCSDSELFLALMNDLSSPANALEYLLPVVAVVDSVFAAQLCLCCAFGGWLNAVFKWWFLEDRPYWWVRETDFYERGRAPTLRQTAQTCEAGPGCPSGHSSTAAMLLLLILLWTCHIMNDRKCYRWWWKYMSVPICAVLMVSVMVARLYTATHFPHQVLLGSLVGAFLAPFLCIYVVDPFVWGYGFHARPDDVTQTRFWHIVSALVTIAIGLITYISLKLCGWDPMWTVKLAFRWCEHPENIHVYNTPMYAFAHNTGHLLGWALCVTPAVAKYRHYTKERSLIISTVLIALIMYIWRTLHHHIPKDHPWKFYVIHFLMCTLKPYLLLRFVPQLSMYPYCNANVKLKRK